MIKMLYILKNVLCMCICRYMNMYIYTFLCVISTCFLNIHWSVIATLLLVMAFGDVHF